MINPTNTDQTVASNSQSMLASSSQVQVNKDMGSSWATIVSHYLSARRTQTQTAYHAQTDSNVNSDNTMQEWLFEAIFEVLVQRLEEGHTVLVLDDIQDRIINNHAAGDSNNEHVELFVWQRQLLQPLLQCLLVQGQGIAGINDSIKFLNHKELWDALTIQFTLSEYERQIANQRYATCVSLYRCMLEIAKSSDSVKNSLSEFEGLLSRNPLIGSNNGLSNKLSYEHQLEPDKPITFQIQNVDIDTPDETASITLWIHRAWRAEYELASGILGIKEQKVDRLAININPDLNPEQQDAIHMANGSAFSVITGGPGTGKTFTVAQLVIALQQSAASEKGESISAHPNLALAAPTGKAAQRMQESLQDAIASAKVDIQLPEAKTVHRLLGIGQGGRPRYHKDNPLSEDIIIIDEASMLGVELANQLVNAVKLGARLILLGDANQLAAVDAGAVLADLCRIPALQSVHKRLEMSRRFTAESGIGKLAKLINREDRDMREVWALMKNDNSLEFNHLVIMINSKDEQIKNSLSNKKYFKSLSISYQSFFDKTKTVLTRVNIAESVPKSSYSDYLIDLMSSLNNFRVLTAGHHGRCGDHYINSYLSEQHRKQLKLPLSKSPWYHGRPIMILQNNYELELFNGDIGICLQTKEGRLQVFFENKKQGIAVNMLSEEMTATAYAITIHKSQGSEFDHVAISFDDQNKRLLSQELIYTAVTRAKQKVSIFSTISAFTYALTTPTIRQTGLQLQFSNFDNGNIDNSII